MQEWWLIVGFVLVVAVLVGLFRPRHRRRHDPGVISDQWIAQHRASNHDPDR